MFSTITLYIISFVASYIIFSWFKTRKALKETSLIRFPPCLAHLPIVGSIFLIFKMKTIPYYFMKKSKTLGNIIAFYICNKYVIMLNGKKTIHEAFVKHSASFSGRDHFFLKEANFNPGGKGIAEHPYNEDFKKYHHISLNVLKYFGFGKEIMEVRIKTEVEDLVGRFKNKENKPFDPVLELAASVSNVISSIIFGKRWSIDDPDLKEGIDIVSNLVRKAAVSNLIDFYPVLKYLPSYKKFHKFVLDVVNKWHKYIDRVLEKVAKDKNVESFYNIYLQELKKLNETEIDISQLKFTIRDLFMAGTETTTTTLQWFIYFMANNTDVQEKIRNEIDEIVGSERFPSYKDKTNLPRLEATLLEVMRIRTILPISLPHITLNDTVIEGVFIPKNVMVLANLYSAHMDPGCWDEPEKFKIDRFLSADGTKVVNQDSIIPFSLGKRSCLGEILARQELFLFASALIQQFEILPPESQDKIFAEENIGITVSPTPFTARFIRRF